VRRVSARASTAACHAVVSAEKGACSAPRSGSVVRARLRGSGPGLQPASWGVVGQLRGRRGKARRAVTDYPVTVGRCSFAHVAGRCRPHVRTWELLEVVSRRRSLGDRPER
jgi:hypothetical protein